MRARRLDGVPVDRAEWRMTTMLHRLSQRLDDLGFRMEAGMTELVRARGRAKLRNSVGRCSAS